MTGKANRCGVEDNHRKRSVHRASGARAGGSQAERTHSIRRRGIDESGFDLSDLKEALERRLAAHGLRSVSVGPFTPLGGGRVLVEVRFPGSCALCRLEVDRRSGAVRAIWDALPWRRIDRSNGDASPNPSADAQQMAQFWAPTAGPHPTD